MATGHSSDSASPESRALRQHSASLVTAIADPLRLSWVLLSNDIIEDATKDEIELSTLTIGKKNSVLVSAVSRKVKAEPSLFHKLVDILKEDKEILLQSLGEKLETTYNQITSRSSTQCTSSRPSHTTPPPPAQQPGHSQPPLETSYQLPSSWSIPPPPPPTQQLGQSPPFGEQLSQFPPVPIQLLLQQQLGQQFPSPAQLLAQFRQQPPPVTQQLGQSLPLSTQHPSIQQLEQMHPPPSKRPRYTQPPLHFPLHPSIVPPQPHSVVHYTDYLRDFYQTSKLPVYNKWPPTPSKKYVNLAVISREEVSSEELKKFQTATIHGDINDIFETKAPIDLQDILDNTSGEKLHCVLVEGAPGVGKTTLAWEISNRWGKGELFQRYTMVMLLRLRDETVQNSTCIADLIFHKDKGYQQEISSYLTYTRGKDTLIILEGLDELPQQLLAQPSIFTHLLAGEMLPQATILITSRPSATVRLWKNWKERVSRHIEILGFTPQNITEYIESVVPTKELSGFRNYLSMNSHIKTMMYVPIHAALVIEIYRCCQRSHKPLPTTVTDLYTSLAQTILLRYLDSHPNYKGNNASLQQFTDLPPPVYQDFYKLTELAYTGVLRQQLIFHDQHQEIEHLGFMDTVTELFPNQNSVCYSCNFLHLSVQEYLASYFVSLMCTHEQEQLLMAMCEQQYLKSMGRFLAGVTQFKSMDRIIVKTVIEGDCRKLSDGSLRLSTYALQLLHECRYSNIIDGHPSYSYMLSWYSQPFEFSALGTCIANSSYRWRLDLDIENDDERLLSTDTVDLLVQALKNHDNPAYNIESINCSYNTPDWVKYLLKEMPQYALQQLQKLELIANNEFEDFQPLPQCVIEHILSPISGLHTLNIILCHPGETICTAIATALHSNSTLTQLGISCNDISDSGATAIATALHSNSTLTQLDISYNDISDSGATAIATALHSNSTLTQLDIHYNNISDSGATAIATTLLSNSTLTQLNISDNGIGDSGATAIATALHSNSTLTQLDIHYNNISDSGATAIATALHSNSTLTQLDISNNGISDSGTTAIATALHSNSALTQLDISNNGISDSGTTAIATALHSNSALTQLDISGNGISDSGTTAIATALHSNNTLTYLRMSNNDISDNGATTIADMLLINKTLQHVNLNYNKNIVNKDGIVRDKNRLKIEY